MSGLDDAAVQSLARICRLALTPAQVADHRERLAPLVAHLEALAAIDLADAPIWSPPDPGRSAQVVTPGASLTVDEALASAPSRRGAFVAVPRVR